MGRRVGVERITPAELGERVGPNWLGRKGDLVKLNLRQCGCGKVWVPEQQAAKVKGAASGWYENLALVRAVVEADPDVDPVIRIGGAPRGRRICPDCRG